MYACMLVNASVMMRKHEVQYSTAQYSTAKPLEVAYVSQLMRL